MALLFCASFEFVPQLGHADARDVDVSIDGQWIAVAGDTTVKLWRRDGVLIRNLEGFTADVSATAISPDATLIAGASPNELRLFRRDGTLVAAQKGEHARTELMFHPSGSWLVIASEQGAVFYDARTLGKRREHRGWGYLQWCGFVGEKLYAWTTTGWFAFDAEGKRIENDATSARAASLPEQADKFAALYGQPIKPVPRSDGGRGEVWSSAFRWVDVKNARVLTHERMSIWNIKKSEIDGPRVCLRQYDGKAISCFFLNEVANVETNDAEWFKTRLHLTNDRLYATAGRQLLIADLATGKRTWFGAQPRTVDRVTHLPDGRIVSALSSETMYVTPNTIKVWSADGRLEQSIDIAMPDAQIAAEVTTNPNFLSPVASLTPLDASRLLVNRSGGATVMLDLKTETITKQKSAERVTPCKRGVLGLVTLERTLDVRRCSDFALLGNVGLAGNLFDVNVSADGATVLVVTNSSRVDDRTHEAQLYTLTRQGKLEPKPFVALPKTARWIRDPEVFVDHTSTGLDIYDRFGARLQQLSHPALRKAVPLRGLHRFVSHTGAALIIHDALGQQVCSSPWQAPGDIASVDTYGGDAIRVGLLSSHGAFATGLTERCDARAAHWQSVRGKSLLGIGADRGSIELGILGGNETVLLYAFGNEWAAIMRNTTGGAYDSSPGAGKFLAITSKEQSYAIDQFAVRYNRPDLILASIGGDTAAVAWYRRLFERRLKKLGVTEAELGFDFAVPTATLSVVEHDGARVRVKARMSDGQHALTGYQLFVNDVPIFAGDGMKLQGNEAEVEHTVAVLPGTSKIEVSARNRVGRESFRSPVTVEHSGASKGALHVVTIGVSRYRDAALTLKYAAKDARDFAALAKKLPQFSQVIAHELLDEQVTPQNISALKARLTSAAVEDMLVVLVAGHGVHDRDDDNTYYFLTHDVDLAALATTAAPFSQIEGLLEGVPHRRKLLLLDTCESGELDASDIGAITAAGALGVASRGIRTKASANTALAAPPRRYLLERERFIYNDLLRRTGAVVMSSSRGGELSYERDSLQNGVFTHALLRALRNKAVDANRDGWLDTRELIAHVARQVSEQTNGLQNPTIDRDNIYQRVALPLAK